MKYLFFFIVCCLTISCVEKNKIPVEIIQPEKMQKILWEVIQAQTLSSQISQKDSTVNEVAETKVLTHKVFELNKIDSVKFDQSYSWYTNHPDILLMVFDSLNKRNQRETLLEIEKRKHPLKEELLKKIN